VVPASGFRDLVAYRLATQLATDLRREVKSWDAFDRWSAGIQLMRAADSIGANIAEAVGRFRFGDRLRFLHIARGSALETEHWIQCAIDRHLVTADYVLRAQEVGRVLNGLITSCDRQRRATSDH
jgi:four helix bundle protein